MTRAVIRALEGRRVSISLADGSRTDDCDLVSVALENLFARGTVDSVHYLRLRMREAFGEILREE